ncbi:MAG: hypothetical protein RL136_3 [Planctomycetota bacterium]|jgi:hypothetical protein
MAAKKATRKAVKKASGTTSKKAVKKAVKKPAKKAVKKAATKAPKTTSKKAVKKPAKQVAKKTAKKTASAAKPARGERIAAITPSRDGAWWTLVLAGGSKVRLSSASAQAAGIRVGGSWSPETARKVHRAAADLELFTRAMAELAEDGRLTRTELVARLGGDAAARRTVGSLARHGWVS